jgi:hypothetical protein
MDSNALYYVEKHRIGKGSSVTAEEKVSQVYVHINPIGR